MAWKTACPPLRRLHSFHVPAQCLTKKDSLRAGWKDRPSVLCFVTWYATPFVI
jgi:hypothetical protein